MSIDYRVAVILSCVVCFFIFIVVMFFFIKLKIIQEQISCVFIEKYSEIKKQHPFPLKTWRWKTGNLGKKYGLRLQINFLLKVEVYPYMLLVSTLGRVICLPYDYYIFQCKRFILNYLLIERIPVREGGIIYLLNGCDKFTELRIYLSSSKINTILEIANNTQKKDFSTTEDFTQF